MTRLGRMAVAGCVALTLACSSTTAPRDAGPADVAVDVPVDTGVEVVVDTGVPDTGPPAPSGIGTECQADQPYPMVQGTCPDGLLCLVEDLGYPNGYCTRRCDTTRCPADAACVAVYGGRVHMCMLACASDEDCRTSDGYSCTILEEGSSRRVCAINEAPVGTRPDGSACFTTAAGPHQLAPLPRRLFTGSNRSASSRSDSQVEAEGNIAIHPSNGHVASTYIALARSGDYMGSSFSANGMAWTSTGRVTDPVLNSTSDPVLDWGRDGTLRMVFLGLQRTSTGSGIGQMHVRVASSTDDGAHWATPVQVEPIGYCPAGSMCDKPWIVSGPSATSPGGEALYISYLRQGSSSGALVLQRSEDGGMTWLAPASLMFIGLYRSEYVAPNLVHLDVAANGTLGAAWIALPLTGTDRVRLGSPGALVMYRRTRDGGVTLDGLRVVSRSTDSPVYTQPAVAHDGDDGSTVHVAYISGTPDGRWDLFLATSTDAGMTWRHRKVNDEPGDPCATHYYPSMVLDPVTHDLHLIWMENRFGDGGVTYARCPADPAMPCSANEAVGDATFTFTTSRNPGVWHGDYDGLALVGREIWAVWSDTRLGAPHMYAAHGTLP